MRFFESTGARIGFCILLVGAGFLVGFTVENTRAESVLTSIKNSLTPIKAGHNEYSFIEPLLAYRVPEATTLGDYVALKASLQATIAHAIATKTVSRVSVYFRDLDAARRIGINQNDTYYPASLLKVPVMVAYYKQAEEDPTVLDQLVVYEAIKGENPFDAPSTLTSGNVYRVGDLIDRMIIDSDNGATFTLLNRINPAVLSAVYDALGITNPGNDSSTYQISNRTYALFFRVLYNATYLSQAYSEKALKLLARASFHDGLVAGIPEGVPAAHKFGEHIITAGGVPAGIELHDCGVIYYPAHPYLLCVMTAAKDLSTATILISTLSKTAYDAVAAQYPK